MAIGFTADPYEKQRELQKDIGKYMALHTDKQVYIGKIVSENDEEIILNPYSGSIYTAEGLEYSLIEKDFSIPKKGIISKQDTDNEEIQHYLDYHNKQLKQNNSNKTSE